MCALRWYDAGPLTRPVAMRLTRRLMPGHDGPGFAATIGGYDGLHRGHQALLRLTQQAAAERGLASMLVTFEPLPREYFLRHDPPARLTSFRERWRLLQATGLQQLCVLRFSGALRNLQAPEFASRLGRMGVRHLVIGHDFRAARDAAADADWLREHGPQFGFTVQVVEPVLDHELRISSRAVRAALAAADLPRAAQLLGRPYAMRGRVQHGAQLGRELGYPTANLALERRRSPLGGVFAVRVHGIAAQGLPGVASLGVRPTINGGAPLLEAHVFDFKGDLYGRELEVEFVAHLRDELRFDTVEDLVQQMHRDAAQARALLAADEG
jgi:riboflavin kinase / FMN adenylyltransferase